MNIRARVLAGLGGKCAWCSASTRALEIDHITEVTGPGNAHRATIKEPIERWLWREYQRTGAYPRGLQLLCTTETHDGCHDRKSGRTPRMPAKDGNRSINVSLPEEMVDQLDLRTKQAGTDRSHVVAAAIQQHLEGGANQSLLDHLHTRLDDQQGRLQAVEERLKTLTELVRNVHDLVQVQTKHNQDFENAANCFYDYVALKQGRRLPWKSRWRSALGGTAE